MTLMPGSEWGEYSSEDDSDSEEDMAPPSKKGGVKEKKSEKKKKGKKSNTDNDDDYTFCISEMADTYYNGIRMLLASNPLYTLISANFADKIINQGCVGGVISQEESDVTMKTKAPEDQSHTFGLSTILNLRDEEVETELKGIMKTLIKACPKSTVEEFKSFLQVPANPLPTKVSSKNVEREEVGLFLSERLVNIPLKLVHMLHQSLLLDLKWSSDNAPGENGSEKYLYRFKKLVCIAELEEGTSSDDNAFSGKDCKKLEDEVFFNLSKKRNKKDGINGFTPFSVNISKGSGGDGNVRFGVFAISLKSLELGVKEFESVAEAA